MTLFFQLIVLGCATGGIYATSALGIVAVFRSSGVINFAHGAVAMAGAYISYTLADLVGLPHVIAIPSAIIAAAAMGLLTYVLVIRPLSSASSLTKVIATLGVFVVIQQSIVLIFGSALRIPEDFLPTDPIRFGGIGIGVDQVILLGAAVVLTATLWAVFRWTRFGLATSAVAENPRALEALGWRVNRLKAVNWSIGGALAGIAGIALAPTLQLQPGSFALLIIPTLASAILGGLRSFPLTLLGGISLGVLQALSAHYIDIPGMGDAVPFFVIIAVLIVLGRSLPLRSHINEQLPRVGSGRIRPIRLALGCVLVGLAATFVLDITIVDGLTITLVTAVLLLSQVVVTGYAGQLSLAQIPIAGAGAILAGRLVAEFQVPFPIAVLAGGVFAIPIALIVGLPSLRARGVSLAIATLGFGVAINSLLLRNNDLNGGSGGVNVGFQTFFGIDVNAIVYPSRYAILCGLIFVALALVVANVRRGRVGRRMLSVRTNERAAASLGVNVAATKLYAFVLAGVIAGIGGTLSVFRFPTLTFGSFDSLTSINALILSMIGGIGYIAGALLGAIGQSGGFATSVVNLWLFDIANYLVLVLGLGLIVQLIVQPNGIADFIAHPTRRREPGRLRRRLRAVIEKLPFTRMELARESRRRARLDAQFEVARASRPERLGGRLEVRNLRVTFGAVIAVDGLTFSVEPGEVVSIIGPNGAGKTTLMDAISGFVASDGIVLLDGVDITRQAAFRRARAGLVRSFQSLELLEDMTVIDNLKCASDPADLGSYLLDLIHPSRDKISPSTAAAIDIFELGQHLDRLPTEISYGTRHLVAIARAVAAGPRVLMLDEPAAGLSETERAEVGVLVRHLAEDWGLAVLLIEHDVELVRRVSNRVIALDFGAQIATGDPDAVLRNKRVVDAYLGATIDGSMANDLKEGGR